MIYACMIVLGFIIGVISAYFLMKKDTSGTLFVNQNSDGDGEYAFIEFNDDPIIYANEKIITLEVKSISQK